MDDQLRRAERAAASGDPEAVAYWRMLCGRRGLFFKDHSPDETLSEWEEVQQDYDDLWWHGNTPRKCGLRGRRDWVYCDFDFQTSVFKTHCRWGHYYVSGNAKRQTLRTHRDGSRRCYRLRD